MAWSPIVTPSTTVELSWPAGGRESATGHHDADGNDVARFLPTISAVARVAAGDDRRLLDRVALLDRPGEPDQLCVRPGQRRRRQRAGAGAAAAGAGRRTAVP